MLKPEDCKPGVEVISLTNSDQSNNDVEYFDFVVSYTNGPREKGKIYTIKEFVPAFPYKDGLSDCIIVEETECKAHSVMFDMEIILPFWIGFFKLVDKKQIEQFSQLCSDPISFKIVETV